MDQDLVKRIGDHPSFRDLVRRRSQFAWLLSSVMLVAYFGFIFLIAFAPEVLARPISSGATITVGVPVSIGLILLAIALTGIYIRRANRTFDELDRRIADETRE